MNNEKDFKVANICCSNCGEQMNFSDSHSSDMVAVFYCINNDCEFNHFMMRVDECNKSFSITGIERDN